MDILTALGCEYIERDRASLLDEAMSRRKKCAEDETLKMKAFTCTLRPRLHTVEPESIKRLFTNVVKVIVSKYKKPTYVEIHYEFTKSMVIHMHGIIIGRDAITGRIVANMRNHFGYTLVKPIDDAQKWDTYINKENALRPTYVYN